MRNELGSPRIVDRSTFLVGRSNALDALKPLGKISYALGLLGSLALLVYFAALILGLKAPSNGYWP